MNRKDLEEYWSKATQLEQLKLQVIFKEADTDKCGEVPISDLEARLVKIFKNLGMDLNISDQIDGMFNL